jgi:two-component system, oxyanion-binding sensor
MTVPMVLSQNGNAISISHHLHDEILRCNDIKEIPFPMPAKLLSKVIENRTLTKMQKLRFATVFPYSCHQYQLLDWLKEGNVQHEIDVLIIPPSEMVSGLQSSIIDGFCVGGPWNAKSVREGSGVTILTSYDIWRDKAEKVLGTTASFYQKEPELIAKLCAALLLACEWLQYLPNRFEAARIMSEQTYLNQAIDVIAPSLLGSCLTHKSQTPQIVEHYNRFFLRDFHTVNAPSADLQKWLLSKMIECQQIPASVSDVADTQSLIARISNVACFNDAVALLN